MPLETWPVVERYLTADGALGQRLDDVGPTTAVAFLIGCAAISAQPEP